MSRDLFGRPCRLPLALWILKRDKAFFQSEPPRSVGPPTAIRQELDRFVKAGLLDERRPDGDNRVYYERSDSPVWAIIRTAADVIGGANDTGPS